MLKLKYLKKTVDSYTITDSHTRAEFDIDVIQSHKGVHFKLDVSGTFLANGLTECMSLLKELVANDCYSKITQEGEIEGKKKFKPVKTSNIDALIARHKASLPWNDGETA
jgi:hypothetical protein